MKKRKQKQCQQSRLIVKNVEIMRQFGGCYKQEVLMNPPLNFTDVSSAAILGEIMHKDLT